MPCIILLHTRDSCTPDPPPTRNNDQKRHDRGRCVLLSARERAAHESPAIRCSFFTWLGPDAHFRRPFWEYYCVRIQQQYSFQCAFVCFHRYCMKPVQCLLQQLRATPILTRVVYLLLKFYSERTFFQRGRFELAKVIPMPRAQRRQLRFLYFAPFFFANCTRTTWLLSRYGEIGNIVVTIADRND